MTKIEFMLGDQLQTVQNPRPGLTLLQYLREISLTGTKEGCAEGDCGACTVALGEIVDGKMQLRAVNSCILPLAAVSGCLVMAVEHVSLNGELHPVQNAMVELHASQCGFCTPGFVMNAFVLYHNGLKLSRDEIHSALAGNLCRCTGYRPLVEAVERAIHGKRPQAFDTRLTKIEKNLLKLCGNLQEADIEPSIYRPKALSALFEILRKHPDARMMAGATDLGLEITKKSIFHPVYLDLCSVQELCEISQTSEFLILGASLRYSRVLPVLEEKIPEFAALIKRIGSLQIRNQGTLGGNIANASPIGDTMPALIALGSEVEIAGETGRRWVALEDFFVGYRQTLLKKNEVISRVRIPSHFGEFRVYKVSKRYEQDISSVCGAFLIQRDEENRILKARICYGGMAATPKRATETEKFLLSKPFDRDTIRGAMKILAEEYSPLSDFRASAWYRKRVCSNLLLRYFEEVMVNSGGGK